jgi:hypothetical protein
MSNLVVRGYNEKGSYITRGYGPEDGVTVLKAIAGSITMVGTLATLFIDGGAAAGRVTQGGIRIDIDIGT